MIVEIDVFNKIALIWASKKDNEKLANACANQINDRYNNEFIVCVFHPGNESLVSLTSDLLKENSKYSKITFNR